MAKGTLEVFGVGRITAQPELETLEGGSQKVDFRLAVNDGYRKADGTDVDHTTFAAIVAWGKLAENICTWVVKGQELVVLGTLVQDQWQNEQGENRSKMYIKARSVQFGAKPGDRSGGEDQQQAQPAAPAAPQQAAPVDEVPF